ncbi:21045_t:CDS:1, partial [Gigaspora rosea]
MISTINAILMTVSVIIVAVSGEIGVLVVLGFDSFSSSLSRCIELRMICSDVF